MMKTTSLILAGAALFAAAFGTRSASANLLANGGLELPPTTATPNGFLSVFASTPDNTTLPGWTITGNVDLIPSTYWQASEGNDSIDLIGSPGLGSVQQTVTGLSIGTVYGLSFDFAVNPDAYDGEQATTKELQVTVTNPASSLIASQLYQGTNDSATRASMNYTSEVMTFTADASTETINFAALLPLNLPVGITAANISYGPVLDNVDLEAITGTNANVPSTPEPASLGLLAAGSLLLLRRKCASSR